MRFTKVGTLSEKSKTVPDLIEPDEREFTGFTKVGNLGSSQMERSVENIDAWLKEQVRKYGRETLTGTASGIGGAVGFTLTGGNPLGAVAGAGLSYAAANRFADFFENIVGSKEDEPFIVEMKKTAADVPLGATMEMAGQSLGKILAKGIGTAPKIGNWLLQKLGRRPSIEVLAAVTDGSPIVVESINEGKMIEEMTGVKFTRAQLDRRTGSLILEDELASELPEAARRLAERKTYNTDRLKDFLEKARLAGGKAEDVGSIQDARSILESQKRAVEVNVEMAARELSKETGILEGTPDFEATGKFIRKELETGRTKARGIGGRKFDRIPKNQLDARKLSSIINDSLQKFHDFEVGNKNIPETLRNAAKVLDESNGMSTNKNLQGLASEIKQDLRDPATTNQARRRLTVVLNEIERVLETGKAIPKTAGSKLKAARAFWQKEVINKFEEGDVAEILKKTKKGYSVKAVDVIDRILKPGESGRVAARSLRDATGEGSDAMEAARIAIRQKFVAATYDSTKNEISKAALQRWLKQFRPAIEELGMMDDFKPISNARETLDEALKLKGEFDRSIASRILKTDVGKEIQSVLGGSDRVQKVNRLIKRFGGDKRALEGLQNAFIEQIQNIAEKDVSKISNIMDANKGVYDILFANAPKKLRAMQIYRGALERLYPGKIDRIPSDRKSMTRILNFYIRPPIGKVRAIVNIGNVVNALQKVTTRRKQELFLKMVLDPNLAYDMLKLARSSPKFPKTVIAGGAAGREIAMRKEKDIENYFDKKIKSIMDRYLGEEE